MPLPFDRDETLTPASKIRSALLNAIQDAIKAMHNRPIHISPASWLRQQAAADWVTSEGGSQVRSVAASGAKQCVLDITPYVIPGDTIKEIVMRWQNGVTPSAGAAVFQVLRAPVATFGTETPLATSAGLDTNTGGANAIRSQTLAVNHVVLADNFYGVYFELDATAGNDQAGLGGISLILGT